MIRYAAAVLLSFSSANLVHAADFSVGQQEPAAKVDENTGWALQVTPYMWAAGLDGSISPFRSGPTIEVDKSFSDVLDELNFGGFVNIWGRYDRFVLSGDIMYVDTTDSHGTGLYPVSRSRASARFHPASMWMRRLTQSSLARL